MKKKSLLLMLSLLLATTLTLGGTLAYLTDTDADINTFTFGNVDITLNEEFQQGSELIPGKDIQKEVTITNTGSNEAWVWYTLAVPKALDNAEASLNVVHTNVPGRFWDDYRENQAYWADGQTEAVPENKTWDVDAPVFAGAVNPTTMTIDGIEYTVYAHLYNGSILPGETTNMGLSKVYLDDHIDIDPEGNLRHVEGGVVTEIDWNIYEQGNPKILVNAFAIQREGFDNVEEAFVAFMKQWTPDGVNMTEDLLNAGLVKFDPVTKWDDNADTSWYDASKTEFELNSADQLAGLSVLVAEGNSFAGKTVKLTDDIDLGAHQWTPIGQTGGYYASAYFRGAFDGQGNTIKNLYITETNEGANYAAGLFGFLDCGMTNTIGNFTIDGAKVNGHHWVGAAAGYLSGNLENVTVKNAEINNTHATDDACGDKGGAVVGQINGTQGKMTGCSAVDCTVTGSRDAGQVVGAAKPSQVVDCTASNVTVTAAGDCTGANVNNAVVGREL